MFEPLFARLADRYQLVAPDYPGREMIGLWEIRRRWRARRRHHH